MKESAVDVESLLQSGFRYAMSLTHDSHQAEDLLHDAWIAVMQADGSFSRTYLFSAIRSRFLNTNRREKLVLIVSIEDLDSIEANSFDEYEILPDIDMTLLDEAIGELRSVEREVLFLMVVEGYTAQEVAELTDRPRGTVLSLLHRGKQKIRCKVEQKRVGVSS